MPCHTYALCEKWNLNAFLARRHAPTIEHRIDSSLAPPGFADVTGAPWCHRIGVGTVRLSGLLPTLWEALLVSLTDDEGFNGQGDNFETT